LRAQSNIRRLSAKTVNQVEYHSMKLNAYGRDRSSKAQ
jgi:hypothetical protein